MSKYTRLLPKTFSAERWLQRFQILLLPKVFSADLRLRFKDTLLSNILNAERRFQRFKMLPRPWKVASFHLQTGKGQEVPLLRVFHHVTMRQTRGI